MQPKKGVLQVSATGYSLRSYGGMITCEPRMPAYADALRNGVSQGSRVIDLGAGPGVFALLAHKLGAGHVTVIEPDPSIEIARRAASDNGCSDQFEFVRGLSTSYEPQEKADLIVSDIRGVLPLFEHHIPTICDVRDRLLKPGGTQIPVRDFIFAALVEVPCVYSRYSKPWLENSYGLDLSAGYSTVINSWIRTYQDASALLTDPELFATLDYRTVEETNYEARISLETHRAGTAHGILLWFDTELAPGIGFSNAPGEPEQIYGQAFFPLERPVILGDHATADVHISAKLVGGDYVWSWAFRANDTSGEAHNFRQSSFKSAVLDMDSLVPRAANFRPQPNSQHSLDIACLGLFDGMHTLRDIAAQLMRQFSGRFTDEAAALNHVADLSARYHRASKAQIIKGNPQDSSSRS